MGIFLQPDLVMSISSEIAGAVEEGDFLRGTAIPTKLTEGAGGDTITLTQRMVSACLGSLVTSLVVTPFDVIRIRIQQQQILPMQCCTGVYSEGGVLELPAAKFTTRRNPNQNTLVANERLFWQSHHYCETAENCTKITSTWQGLRAIARTEGIASVWRGLLLTLLQSVPLNIIYFTGYEYIRDNSPIKEHMLNPLLCGAGARTLSATFVSPIELVKTRLQSIPLDSKEARPKMLTNLVQDMYQVVRERGVKTLFTGLQLTLWRDVPFLGVYWMCYEVFKRRLGGLMSAEFEAKGNTPAAANPANIIALSNDGRVLVTSFVSGSLAGSIAALLTHPFDVGKTRLQIASEAGDKRALMSSYLYRIFRNEGITALYAGITPRVMKIAPACAIMISSYEFGKKFFKNGNGH